MAKKNLLFLCTGNSCRSQMAEGWAKKFFSSEYNIFSAGTKKHGMNERAMKVMLEAGVDISSQYSKIIDELPAIKFDFVITVCDSAKENCPYSPGGKIIHLGFQDPPSLTKDFKNEEETLAVYRRVREEIKDFVLNLKKILDN